ncbi:MFS transporter, partial [Streptacidiphilus carbonis]|uniref:MFS transporter n=1 Tax=Streptacidiphilus carbonis TaxID=105422 RepID=UPI0013776B37
GWSAVFLVPVPVCAGAAVAGWRLLPDGGRRRRAAAAPGVPLPRLVGADTVLALTSAALVAVGYTSTLWVQTILHCGPVRAGLAFLPLSGGILLGAGLAPGLIRRFGLRAAACGGLVVAVAGLAPLSRLPAQAGLPQLLPWLGLLALGFGVQSVPVSVVATAVPGHEAVASAVYQTAGQLGGGAGLALLSGLAAGRTAAVHATGNAALALGYDAAFGGAALALAAAAVVAAGLLRPVTSPVGTPRSG